MIFAVIDTNVLVSALLTQKGDTATVKIIEKVLLGKITPIYSSEMIEEYRAVLSRKKFGFSPELTDKLIKFIEKQGIMQEIIPSGITLTDMDDLPFYELALQNKETYLITGNIKHFPNQSFIVTPREFLNIIE
ncbi:MAG: putative toxin-antitoxin system toxin component, PIN family [Neisseriaceae bacterium]|nr:putative toxin-antitoxin system toxin component, PIN family [Neisseriaceae bacterium]MBR3425263.1 putative toxin-antitoxin system toxin component, PIN family [Neisseriaceae bacterium]